MSSSSRWSDLSVRIYRTLIGVYPASFRREYGEEMTEVFRELAGDAWQRRGMIGLILLWLQTVVDLFLSSTLQHSYETRRRITMAKVLFEPAYSVLALAIILLVAALLTPADPLSMLLVGLPTYGVYLGVARWARRSEGSGSGALDSNARKERIV